MSHGPILSIAAKLDLTDDVQRQVCEVIRRTHSGSEPMIRNMLELQRVGDELIEMALWNGGGFAVIRWSLKIVSLTWRDFATHTTAYRAFVQATQ